MPKCCASCDHFKFIGRLEDDRNPCVDRWGDRPSTSKYGRCNINKIDVFVDQVCPKFITDTVLVDVIEVPSAGRVLEPFQGELI